MFLPPSECLAFPDVTYSFYPVYARFYDIPFRLIRLNDDFSLPISACLEPSAGLVLANPNAPTGISASLGEIASIAAADRNRLLIVDEAYVDFGGDSAVSLMSEYDNILVIQTCSKSRALAGLRVGYALGAPGLVEGLERVRDSFNSYTLDCLAQTAAIAAFDASEWFEQTRRKIILTREKTAQSLRILGFQVLPSSANFLFVRHPVRSGADLYRDLRHAGILVRYFKLPRIENYLRISVGTDAQMDKLVEALSSLLA
jgi:histidinol-phosphate aminotransferase